MIPVTTILQVETFYKTTGFSCLYEALLPGGQPERKTFVFLRDSDGNVVGSIFTDAETVARLTR
jgi:hypothetical protein